MFLQSYNFFETGMSITYADIREYKVKIDRQYDVRRSKLQKLGYKLVKEYKKSLCLPAERWRDSKGVDRPYVSVGHLNEDGAFQKTTLAAINLTDDYTLTFKVSTVIDDQPLTGGKQFLSTISMLYRDGMLNVDVGHCQRSIIVAVQEEEDAFIEVCLTMKQIIISALSDTRSE